MKYNKNAINEIKKEYVSIGELSKDIIDKKYGISNEEFLFFPEIDDFFYLLYISSKISKYMENKIELAEILFDNNKYEDIYPIIRSLIELYSYLHIFSKKDSKIYKKFLEKQAHQNWVSVGKTEQISKNDNGDFSEYIKNEIGKYEDFEKSVFAIHNGMSGLTKKIEENEIEYNIFNINLYEVYIKSCHYSHCNLVISPFKKIKNINSFQSSIVDEFYSLITLVSLSFSNEIINKIESNTELTIKQKNKFSTLFKMKFYRIIKHIINLLSPNIDDTEEKGK